MRSGPTRKHDYEKGKRQKATQNPDYHERFADEGNHFDRGGKERPKMISFRGSKAILHFDSLFRDDKLSMVRTIENNWKFIVEGQIGTVSSLRKKPKVGEFVSECFEIIRKSILSADTFVEVALNPNNEQRHQVLEFRCPLRPVDPYPNPVFKKFLAFSVKLVGPALKHLPANEKR